MEPALYEKKQEIILCIHFSIVYPYIKNTIQSAKPYLAVIGPICCDISDRYRFAHRQLVGPISCRLQQIGRISDSYHFHNFLTWLISLYRTDIGALSDLSADIPTTYRYLSDMGMLTGNILNVMCIVIILSEISFTTS